MLEEAQVAISVATGVAGGSLRCYISTNITCFKPPSPPSIFFFFLVFFFFGWVKNAPRGGKGV
jgi:hypothetical protein